MFINESEKSELFREKSKRGANIPPPLLVPCPTAHPPDDTPLYRGTFIYLSLQPAYFAVNQDFKLINGQI